MLLLTIAIGDALTGLALMGLLILELVKMHRHSRERLEDRLERKP